MPEARHTGEDSESPELSPNPAGCEVFSMQAVASPGTDDLECCVST